VLKKFLGSLWNKEGRLESNLHQQHLNKCQVKESSGCRAQNATTYNKALEMIKANMWTEFIYISVPSIYSVNYLSIQNFHSAVQCSVIQGVNNKYILLIMFKSVGCSAIENRTGTGMWSFMVFNRVNKSILPITTDGSWSPWNGPWTPFNRF
jgi:hypothetical protein